MVGEPGFEPGNRLVQSEGTFQLGFLKQVSTYVLLPIVVLLARVFPTFGERFASSLEPLLSILQ